MIRRSFLITIWSLSAIALVGCGSTRDVDRLGASKLSDRQIESMTLPERAATIEYGDPISRVERLLGKPIETSPRVSMPHKSPRENIEGNFQVRSYRLTPDLHMVIMYGDASDTARLSRSLGGLGYDIAEEFETVGDDSVRGGYADWFVGRIEFLEGEWTSLREQVRYLATDNDY